MCLAVPGKIERKSGEQARVNVGGNRLDVSTALLPQASVGDWVLVHAGFAITVVPEDEARETWELVRQMQEMVPDEHGYRDFV